MTALTRIIFPHCPKTGGTTLKERYQYNKQFVAYDINKDVENAKVIFGHSVEVDAWEDTDVYITCLRDPVSRVMSMYNFFKTQLLYLNPKSPDVDFYLWYTNKDVIRPMPTVKQYEYYLFQSSQKFLAEPNENKLYTNLVLEWDVDADKSSISETKTKQFQEEKDEIEKYNMETTWRNVMFRFNHVMFQDQDIVKEFDNLLDKYNMNMDPWKEMTRTNETSFDLNKHGYKYITFADLDDNLQQLVFDDLKYDIEFYKRCEDKWRC